MFLKLKTLKIKAFRRFAKEQVIDFTQREKIFQIDGIRAETGGSSGSGKSSIIMAIDYLFGVSDIADTKLQSWLTKEPIEVEATFEAEDLGSIKNLTITRGKKTGLVIDLDGEITSGSSKLSEEKLDEIIGISRNLFRRMYHKRQKEGGFFVNLKGSESYKTLVDILGLKDYTDRMEKIDQIIKDDKLILIKKESNLESLLKNLNDYSNIIKNLKKPELEKHDDIEPILLELKEKTESLYNNTESKNIEINSIVKPINKDTIEVSSEIIAQVSNIIVEINELEITKKAQTDKKKNEIDKILQAKREKEKELNNINTLNIEYKNLSEKEDKLIKELRHIEQSECPTCLQAWITSSANEAIVKIQSQILNIENRKLDICAETQKENSVKETLVKLDVIYKNVESKDFTYDIAKQIDNKRSEMAILNAKRQEILQTITNENNLAKNEYNLQINNINYKYITIENDLKSRMSVLKSQISQINSLLYNYDNSVMAFEDNYQVFSSNVIKTKAEYKKLEIEIDKIKKSVNIGLEAKRAIKSYTMTIFQDSLDEIGEQATRILNTTPNMATASIYFESAKENKDGKIKEEVNGVLSVDGEEDVDIACFSGGEKTSIELAVDLAFLNMVENKVKIGCDFFLLDEPMQGLDFVNAAPIIEMLRELDGNKRIAIIEHNQEIKEIIDDKIVVERIGTESNIMG